MSSEAFEFPLQKILEWREAVERERALSLARALKDERGARTRLDQLRTLLQERGTGVARARSAGTSSVGHLQNLHLILDQLEVRVEQASDSYSEAQEELEVSMAEFKGAHRDRKTLDHLRERREEEWRVEKGREDQRRTDEASRTRRGLADSLGDEEES
jgi:flagellar FliJ protein